MKRLPKFHSFHSQVPVGHLPHEQERVVADRKSSRYRKGADLPPRETGRALHRFITLGGILSRNSWRSISKHELVRRCQIPNRPKRSSSMSHLSRSRELRPGNQPLAERSTAEASALVSNDALWCFHEHERIISRHPGVISNLPIYPSGRDVIVVAFRSTRRFFLRCISKVPPGSKEYVTM